MSNLDVSNVMGILWVTTYINKHEYKFQEPIKLWLIETLGYTPEIVVVVERTYIIELVFRTDTDALLFKIVFADNWNRSLDDD